jgi:formate hydrogenlyase subunit 3/multisubunit Na+/H+ antiporter MnhD subunit
MTLTETGLAAAVAAGGLATLAGLVAPERSRTTLVGWLSALMAAAAGVAAVATLTGGARMSVYLAGVLPLAGVRLELDPLGAVFVAATALVALPASIFAVGYCRHGLSGRVVQATYPLFVLSLLLVPTAASASTFLVLWELMALTSLVLVLAEHRHHPAAREAGWWYAVMTHLGLVLILVAFFLLAAHAPGDSFAALRRAGPSLSPLTGGLVFLAALGGFGSKAGVVPLHVWLPRAHPEAPSHVSALMSGAMVKLGVYGLVRVGWDLLGGGPRWWGVTVLAVGAVSALFGILHALVDSDLKRLLAYSTTENIGLIFVGVGAAGLYGAAGNHQLASVAAAAALVHVMAHAAAKGLLFLGAGSVLAATGERNLDRLGGLARGMPVTTATFAVGALTLAALPPLGAFVSEWLLLQSLVHGLPSTSTLVTVAMPVAVAAVALTGGLAAATFVKALGTGFLALPRSVEAAVASEGSPTMRTGQLLLAGACVALGVGAGGLAQPLRRALAVVPPLGGGLPLSADGPRLHLAGVAGSLSPMVLAGALTVGVALTLAALRASATRRSRRTAENWGCGRTLQTSRMEYTATSFAEPLVRVFDDVLRPDRDVVVDHQVESTYYVEAIRFRQGITDAVDTHLYGPVVRAGQWWGEWARTLQNGSVHRYLAYALGALVVVLVVAR